jgi:predicted dienelactone hydrolase
MSHATRIVLASATLALLVAGAPAHGRSPETMCLGASGGAGSRCLRRYLDIVERCRGMRDAACETAVYAADGVIDERLAATGAPIARRCSDASAEGLGYIDLDDLAFRVPEACTDFAEDLLDLEFADDLDVLSPEALRCQRNVTRLSRRLRNTVIREHGARCFLRAFRGGTCDRARRDVRVARDRSRARGRIAGRCGATFDDLGLSALAPGASTLEERVDDLLAVVIDRARHFAQRVYPPNDLGPTADFGPFPVGVTTLALADPSRPFLGMPPGGPRPVLTEVYYPSTAAAVTGVPRDVVRVFNIPITETPAYRDVARAAGTFPVVVFSHGNGGIRFQSFFFAAHLASHGFIVATPDHHGNTFVDGFGGITDPAVAINRPLDMSFLIDELLALDATAGHLLEDAVDADRIGASGHSFGGYTTFTLAGGAFGLGTFTDPRVKAIFPQAPSALAFPDAFFATITVPTLIVGGSIDGVTPFLPDQQRPFDNLPSGAAVVGLAQLVDGGHFTFSDFCEVPRALLAFLGGFEEACEPRHLPWRHAHDLVNYLSLNFFDGVLNGNAGALARLDPAVLATIEDLVYQSR